MAAVSEVTATRIVQSYVSSNSYYGYVPPINETTTTTTTTATKFNNNNNQYLYNSQQSKIYFNNTNSDERTYQSHQQQQNNENNGLAMETDDIDNHYNGDYKLHCQNNHYVIPEMVMRLDNNNKINTRSNRSNSVGDSGGRGIGDSVGFIYRINHSDADAAHLHNNNNNNNNNNIYNYNHNGMVNSMEIHRRNRKRNNYDHAGVDQGFSHGQLKKFRPDGGNKRVYRNTRSCTGDIGSSAVHNEPTTHLAVSNSVCSIPIQSQVISFTCNNGNGNPSVLQSSGNSREIDLVQSYDIRVSARDNKTADKNSSVLPVTSANNNNIVDYETMLMETHGCLAYHLYRHQFLDINTFEAEF
ncbi:putative uncharacterized protein DDB_G0289263 [Cotesia glomerata]|uniref:putative uncharacterized protein DDB_G0289263 n=1 Tax=Cotesia glomerata TaxID=32391 RepID=UPI001D010641|nr:putative uncharacterized protein DDB_G0289263 [Cotesia glomerata]